MQHTTVSEKFNIAIRLEKGCDYEGALKEYKSILLINPNFRDAYVNIGSLYSRMNKLGEAMQYYMKALSLGQDYITLFNVGSIFYKMGKYAEAIPNLKKSYTINTAFILSRLVIGLCYSRLNEFAFAEKHFIAVLKSWPGNRVAMTALAMIYYNAKKYKQSLQLIDGLLQIDTNNVKIRGLKSDLLLKIGHMKESLSEIKKIKKATSTFNYFDAFIKSVPVEIYTDKYGSIDDKIKTLKKNIYDDPANIISLSLCHLLAGDTDSAIDCLSQLKKTCINFK
jgi:tetratricopeptide (TPR) repeat protein